MKKNTNVYKPRFKIAFQAKSKIWAYKNSRLRHFFSIRGRRLFRGGFFRRNVIVANTLKWTVTRRYIKPYSRRIRARRGKSRYRNTFYLKQQLRHFYGKLTEVAFRSIYKTHLLNTFDRNRSFFGSLEQRADMFLFRMRLLPTIYACNQYIHHQGLLINFKRIEKCPSTLIRIGHTISLPKIYWDSMANYMLYRVYYRVYGKLQLKKRLFRVIKRKVIWLSSRRFKKRNRHWSFWKIKLRMIKRFTQFWKIYRNLCLFYRKIFELDFIAKYKNNPAIYKISMELFVYRTNFISVVHKFIFNFRLFWKNITKYYWKPIDKRKLKNKPPVLKIKSHVLKNSPRLFILILMHSYNILREFKYIVSYVKERALLITALLGLEELKQEKYRSYSYLVKKYDLEKDIKILFGVDTIPLEQLIQLLHETWTKTLSDTTGITEAKDRLIKENEFLYHHFYLRSFIKKYILRWRRYYNKIKRKKVIRPGALAYFLINRKYKKRRRRHISRFKKIHWYIPNYIYFDVHTLRGTLLYVPRANEIVHPFKCSLFKIFSFYKALGI